MRARAGWMSAVTVAVTIAMMMGAGPASAGVRPATQAGVPAAVAAAAGGQDPVSEGDDQYLVDVNGDGVADETVDLSDECGTPDTGDEASEALYWECVAEALGYGTREHQTITVQDADVATTVGRLVTIQAKASSGLPVEVKVSGPCEARSGDTVLAKGVGVCGVAVEQPGDQDWHAAPAALVTMRISAAPVTVTAKLDTGTVDSSGRAYAKRGATVAAQVTVDAPDSDLVPVTGRVSVFVDEAGTATAVGDVDAKGRATVAFQAPQSIGQHAVRVSYQSADGSYLPTDAAPLDLHVGKVASPSGAVIALSMQGDPSKVRVGEKATFEAEVYPLDPNGKVTLRWEDMAGEHELMKRTFGKATVAFVVDDLGAGDYPVIGRYEGDVRGKRFADESDVQVAVVDPNADFDVTTSDDPNPQNREAGKPASRDRGKAPEIRFLVKTPTRAIVPMEGVASQTPVLVRIEQPGAKHSGKITMAGDAKWNANGTLTLPTLQAASTGYFTIRLVPKGSKQPYLVRVRVTPKPAPVADPDYASGANTALDALKELSKDLIKMIPGVNKMGGTVGWGLGKLIGLAAVKQPSEVTLAKQEILAELGAATAKLDGISKDIATAQQAIAKNHCDQMVVTAVPSITDIDDLKGRYKAITGSWMGDARAAGTPNAGGLKPGESQVANKWVDEAASRAMVDANTIHRILMGVGQSGGAIDACADAAASQWRAGAFPALGEAKYYQAVLDLVRYLQDYEVVALSLAVEANHALALRAWQGLEPIDAVATPKPELGIDELAQICAQPFDKYANTTDIKVYCGTEVTNVNTVYDNLMDEFVRVGAGYSLLPAAQGAVSTRVGNPNLLWVTDLGKYGDRTKCEAQRWDPKNGLQGGLYDTDEFAVPSSGTSKTLMMDYTWNGNGVYKKRGPASLACGPTVGTTNAFSGANASGLGLNGWRVASASDWSSLLMNPLPSVGSTVRELLMSRGIALPKNVIVYTGDTVPASDEAFTIKQTIPGSPLAGDKYEFKIGNPQGMEGLCFLDTSSTVGEGAKASEARNPIFCGMDRTPFSALTPPVKVKYEGGRPYSTNITNDVKLYVYKMWWTQPEWTSKSTNPDFYRTRLITHFWTVLTRYGHNAATYEDYMPGWMSAPGMDKQAQPEFRWPVRDVSAEKCEPITIGSGASVRQVTPNALSSAGVRSMCGADFAQWLIEQIGEPPVKPAA